jgi:two-component system nitrate/nitrite response regulator NarL
MPITLALADRHPIVLDGLDTLFSAEPDLRVCARCSDGPETVAAVERQQPDVLVLDSTIRPSWTEVVQAVRDRARTTKVVLLAGEFQEEEVLEGLRWDIRGMFLKDLASKLLLRCVRKVHAGAQWLETRISAHALGSLLRRESSGRRGKDELTPRELDVVRMAASGLPSREVARRLSISPGTVKLHLHNVYRKVKVPNRVGLVLYAQSKQLV